LFTFQIYALFGYFGLFFTTYITIYQHFGGRFVYISAIVNIAAIVAIVAIAKNGGFCLFVACSMSGRNGRGCLSMAFFGVSVFRIMLNRYRKTPIFHIIVK